MLEHGVFTSDDQAFMDACKRQGCRTQPWQDTWWETGGFPQTQAPVVFRGSLGNAAKVAKELSWQPGAYCRVGAFYCSAWYPGAASFLVHAKWHILPASQLVADVEPVLDAVGSKGSFFVRPDSPLKPFSGRVLRKEKLSLDALDHGFYYDDPDLPVVVAPVIEINREWRYVVVDRRVVAGSVYQTDGRVALADDPGGEAWRFASETAEAIHPPEPVYVMDVCLTAEGMKLLELNPFSGADLYACDAEACIQAIATLLKP